MGPKESPALEAAILGLMVLMSVTSYGELSPYAFLLLAASDILERKFLIIDPKINNFKILINHRKS